MASTEAPTKTRKRNHNIPENESNADRFRRVAPMRTNKAIQAIRNVAQTSSTASYEYTQDEVAKIIAAMRAEIDKADSAFAAGGVGRSEFVL